MARHFNSRRTSAEAVAGLSWSCGCRFVRIGPRRIALRLRLIPTASSCVVRHVTDVVRARRHVLRERAGQKDEQIGRLQSSLLPLAQLGPFNEVSPRLLGDVILCEEKLGFHDSLLS
ncbi:unnamed protein product [Protopolystoma xenopodis]|uniref:Uncharacterized protein n=1 Tax=Protopolystoma xenopodis TaxID=117903 RepID=A0A448X7Y3_9PLAT|nr:unnamed protein product [Protopolystoma xenopodis]